MGIKKVTVSFLFTGVSMWAGVVSAQTILRVHHFLPGGANFHVMVIAPWCAKIEKESQGDLKCQIYPAMQLGGQAPQLFEQVRSGAVDIVWTVPTYTEGRFIKTEVFELPFMATTARQGAQALWEYTHKYALDEYAGVKPLFMHTAEGYAFHSNKPIRKMEDLRGMRIRAANRISARMIRAMGAQPVNMPMPQIRDAFARKEIDGALATWESVPILRLYDSASYHTETDDNTPRFVNTVFLFGMNQARYDSLTPEQKRVIDNNSGIKMSEQAGAAFDQALAIGRQLARQNGNHFIVIDRKELARWEKVAATVDDAWIRELQGKGIDSRKLHSEARALLQKYKN